MAEIYLHFNRSCSSHLNTYKVRFFGTLSPELCYLLDHQENTQLYVIVSLVVTSKYVNVHMHVFC